MKPVLFFLLLLCISKSYGQTAEDYINRGNEAKTQQDYRLALNSYLKAYEYQPQNASLTYAIALMYFYLDKLDSSIFFYSEFLKNNPEDTFSYFQRGLCYLYNNDYKNALDDLYKCEKLSKKKNPDVLYNIGKCYEGTGDWDEAISDFNQTLTLRKNDKTAYFELGYCYTLTFDKQDAMLNYNRAVSIDPEYWDAYLNRGLLFESQFSNYSRAHQDFEKCMDLKPKNKLAYLYEGSLFNDERKFTQAKVILDQVLALYPDFGEAYYQHAFAMEGLGDNSSCCNDLNMAEKLGYKKATEMKKKICK